MPAIKTATADSIKHAMTVFKGYKMCVLSAADGRQYGNFIIGVQFGVFLWVVDLFQVDGDAAAIQNAIDARIRFA